MNKNIIKEMFDKKIDKDKIYQNIINKNKIRKRYGYVFSLTCLLIIVVVGIVRFSNKEVLDDNIDKNIDKIIINKEKISSGNGSIAGGVTDIAGDITYIDEIIDKKVIDKLEYGKDRIKKINELEDYNLTYAVKYTYNDLSGYILEYTNSLDKKSINIFMSLNMKMMPREIINQEEILDRDKSIIDNQEVVIVNNIASLYDSEYVGFFNRNNIYFDVGSVNLSEEEFINIIKDIIK